PFGGETPPETINAILTSDPRPVTDHKSKGSEDLEGIVERSLQKDRARRYSTISEMLESLKALQHRLQFAAELERAPLWRRWMQKPAAVLSILFLVALAIGWPLFWSHRRSPATEGKQGIAVLPFENLSDEKTNAYFADGIQDEILMRLSKIADLKVISRTST